MRTAACLLVLLPLVTFCVGCRKPDNSASSSAGGPAASAPSTSTVHHIRIAAAADLQYAMRDLSDAFRHIHPDIDVAVTFGSSGNFFLQLQNHAPFDMFFSADARYPAELVDKGLASKDSQFTYATGRIVLWVPNESKLNIEQNGLEALLDPAVKKVAIANPRHAPYGRAAEAALEKLGIWDRLSGKLVLGENIAQAAQFVQSGSADAGIVALSLAISPPMKKAGRYHVIAPDLYPPLRQAAVTLSLAQEPAAAEQFRKFLTGPQGRQILEQFGFTAAQE